MVEKKLQLTQEKYEALKRLSSKEEFISALAIDQRGSLKRMIKKDQVDQDIQADAIEFKELVSNLLTPFSSSILLDPEYGLPASKLRDKNAGLLIAYEKTGYDATEPGRLPDILSIWSVKRLKEVGADAVKFLLYYDVDESEEINNQKHAFIERIGSECVAEDIPFFLEIVSYDANIDDVKGAEYAKVKPHKVIDAQREFSKPQYHVDVLKVEVPVTMSFVEGFGDEIVYTVDEAKRLFKEQSDASHLPYIFLSAGVSAKMFQDTLTFAKEAGAEFNGVLCGRATWKDATAVYAKNGVEATKEWLKAEGKKNIEDLNIVLKETATPWTDKVEVIN
ncbi:tagatose-bisphosphate aldolase [Atopobacter phocae]|uniref:tagatose-bisphosphate aldolase n=1 Tax=Atopobacter phocae TaxID=136492 RepID=UPI0004B4A180|nr:tagatose-bisphosphate aldolase [Atopobacter phocae]